ncbi:MAG: helix-turn-helix domain-containing protein, partial [Methanoculleus sp.]
MDDLIRNLMALGLTEYEARVYAALVGIGEGSARQI